MSTKREQPPEIKSSSPKRVRISYAEDDDRANTMTTSTSTTTSYERPRNHPVYGQKSAFPGLDTAADDELFYGPADDGMEYLRMVRSEANSLPTLFTVPKVALATEPTIQEPGEEESQEIEKQHGSYADGVYIAPPTAVNGATAVQPNESEKPSVYPDAQASYHNLLRHRFLLLRSTLKCAPPLDAISGLDESHPISFPTHSVSAKKEWRRLLLSVDPQMVQLACMDMDSVLGVLTIMARLMSENFRSGDVNRVRRLGTWAWGLLGKCREVGELGTEEVGEIRGLGKRAVKILEKMKEDELRTLSMAAREGESSGSEEDQQDEHAEHAATEHAEDQTSGPVEDLEAAKARLQLQIKSENEELVTEADAPDQITGATDMEETGAEDVTIDLANQTHAMLDMVIMVVGEFYGQRDLLDAREIWESPDISSG